MVNLQSDILYRVLKPHLVFIFSQHNQGQSQFKQNCLDVLLAPFSRNSFPDSDINKSERSVEGFGAHKKRVIALQDDKQMRLTERWSVYLFKINKECFEDGRAIATCFGITRPK